MSPRVAGTARGAACPLASTSLAAFNQTSRSVICRSLANDHDLQFLAGPVLEMHENAIMKDVDAHLQHPAALGANLDYHVGSEVVLEYGNVLRLIRGDRADDLANRHMSRLRIVISSIASGITNASQGNDLLHPKAAPRVG